VCVCVCIHAYVYARVRARAHTHTSHTYTDARTHGRTLTQAPICRAKRTTSRFGRCMTRLAMCGASCANSMKICLKRRRCGYMYIFIDTHTHSKTHTPAHQPTLSHTLAQIYIYIYIYIYILYSTSGGECASHKFGLGFDLTGSAGSNSKMCRVCQRCMVSFLDSQNVNLKGCMFVVRNLVWNFAKKAELYHFYISVQSRVEFRPSSCAQSRVELRPKGRIVSFLLAHARRRTY
jgi:hypothetical protein